MPQLDLWEVRRRRSESFLSGITLTEFLKTPRAEYFGEELSKSIQDLGVSTSEATREFSDLGEKLCAELERLAQRNAELRESEQSVRVRKSELRRAIKEMRR